jgi:hypothetical protein
VGSENLRQEKYIHHSPRRRQRTQLFPPLDAKTNSGILLEQTLNKPHLYVKKPIPVEAYQWDGSRLFRPAPGFEPILKYLGEKNELFLDTLEGWMLPQPESFILKGPMGEYWAVRKEQFLATYAAIPQD